MHASERHGSRLETARSTTFDSTIITFDDDKYFCFFIRDGFLDGYFDGSWWERVVADPERRRSW